MTNLVSETDSPADNWTVCPCEACALNVHVKPN